MHLKTILPRTAEALPLVEFERLVRKRYKKLEMLAMKAKLFYCLELLF